MVSNVAKIRTYGQKIWLDNISRRLLMEGHLQKLITYDKIAGITSNPAIFLKAITSDPLYQRQVDEVKQQNLTPLERYEKIVLEDIKSACEMLLPMYKETNGEDGYVSLEVAPSLSHDSKQTIISACHLWEKVNFPNLMIKVPGTEAGCLAFEELIMQGVNVNVTLLFSLPQVEAIWDAYLRALNFRRRQGLPVDKIKAVASFFLSRVDTALDNKLPKDLQGKGAISLACVAYLKYKEIFYGPKFAELAKLEAKPQYLLWASTGTKNPNYSDTLYVEELIGMDTINTMPEATLDAFRDHGNVQNKLETNLINAKTTLNTLENKANINMQELGEKLQYEGLELFNEAFGKLMDTLSN